MTDAAGDVTMTAYDPVGNVSTMTSPGGNVTSNGYDADNRVIQVTDSIGLRSATTYDAEGNVLSRTDGNGNTTTATYDAINRITVTTDPLGFTTATTYDAVGNLLSTTDRNGQKTTYSYDAVDRRTAMTDPLLHTTHYQYDGVGNRLSAADANGNATSYLYDAVNRPITDTYADGNSVHYQYDAVGNRLSRTDQNGTVTSYAYSPLYFLTGRGYSNGDPSDTMTYDLSGRMLSATRGAWSDSFAYDGADRVTASVQNGASITYAYVIPAPTSRTIDYPGGRQVTESYDLRNRVSQIDDGASPPPIVQYQYDAGDRIIGREYRNGTTTAYVYDADDRMTALTSAVAGFTYGYDKNANKSFENKTHDIAHSESYAYDAADRLVTYKVGTWNGAMIVLPITQTQYTLDPVDNWTTKVTNLATETRTHNDVNEITVDNGHAFTYDADGNLLTDTAYSYAYDGENRLVGVTRLADAAVVGQYQYDALSRRVQKIADPNGAPVTTQYFYDDTRVIEEQDGLGHTRATYVYGQYTDDVLTMARGGTDYYYHQNQPWSVEAVTDGTAAVVERYDYDAYGAPSVATGAGVAIPNTAWGTPHSAIGNPYLFTGRELDEEDGLYFYRARAYDDAKGRFLQRDPDGYVDAMNLYDFVRDNPVNRIDPTGRKVFMGNTRYDIWENTPAYDWAARACRLDAKGEEVLRDWIRDDRNRRYWTYSELCRAIAAEVKERADYVAACAAADEEAFQDRLEQMRYIFDPDAPVKDKHKSHLPPGRRIRLGGTGYGPSTDNAHNQVHESIRRERRFYECPSGYHLAPVPGTYRFQYHFGDGGRQWVLTGSEEFQCVPEGTTPEQSTGDVEAMTDD